MSEIGNIVIFAFEISVARLIVGRLVPTSKVSNQRSASGSRDRLFRISSDY